ncbi:MAG: DUF1963 domain-containing protein [Pseudanabaena frigida]|uniref:DUF1963 domain-containing protein n=1 Tax=Pseudanabaena frigida TaxID=945775 RepID=A0A2W4Y339_9CYAN|nr:MAG: DUF1963 domain-containing protein [Pseudanabaena frigida]
MNSQISKLIDKHDLGMFADLIEAAIQPAIHLSKVDSQESAIGASRIGGLPDVPADFQWVLWQNRPLSFLAQIDCADLQGFDSAKYLPNSGMLYFFYDEIEQPWGFDPSDRGSSAIIYHPSTENLIPSSLPEGADIDSGWLFTSYALKFREVLSLPSYDSLAFEQMSIPQDRIDDYVNLIEDMKELIAANEPMHQMLGHSSNIQGDMQLECQLTSHGIHCDDASGYNSPIAKDQAAGASDWLLLLQLDSDDDVEMMWGDVGMLYFWIRKSSLQSKRFDEAWTILQCS